MSSLAQAIEELSISERSPKGRVTLTLAGRRVTVVVHGLGSSPTPERELAQELTAAWCRALSRERVERERLRLAIRGEATREPVPEIVARIKERRAAIEAIEVDARSPGGSVWARRSGSTTAEIRIRPQTLGHLDEESLAREIEAAIDAVNDARTEARAAL